MKEIKGNNKDSISNKYQVLESLYTSNSSLFDDEHSQLSYLMIQNLIESPVFPASVKKRNLKQIVLEVLKGTALSELQIPVWSLILGKNGFKEYKFFLRQTLLYSAFLTKELMGESNLHVLTKFTKNDPDFGKNFIIWKKSKSQIDRAIREINREYSKLIREKTKKINYNYYTDDIIAQYLPYKTKDKKERIKMIN